MHRSPFSPNHLRSCIRAGDSRRFGVDLDTNADLVLESAAASVSDGTIPFTHRVSPLPNGKQLFKIESIDSALVLRAMSRYLRRSYGINVPGRDEIIRGVLESLLDATPATLIRCDISSFYECVDADAILSSIQNSPKIHPEVKSVISQLYSRGIFSTIAPRLPRGIGLSTILSEIALQEFDKRVRCLPGVYRYFRFADDILVLSTRPDDITPACIEALLTRPLRLNNKTQRIELRSFSSTLLPDNVPRQVTFTYLGYQFNIENVVQMYKCRSVSVRISPNKLSDRKTKAILSLKAFAKTKNVDLLLLRLRYLTSNYRIRRTGNTHTSGRTSVWSGIYYNYKFCGLYRNSGDIPSFKGHECNELKELDGFLGSLLWGHNNPYRAMLLHHATPEQIRRLKQCSFASGFRHRITKRFTRDQVSLIRKAWKDA